MVKTNNKIPKRIVTKIGDIFCVEFNDNTKGYFQYIANDMTQLNSSVIRVFRTHYPINANVDIDSIINDDIDFYAHTVLRAGIQNGVWYKKGKSEEIGSDKIQDIIFLTAPPFEIDKKSLKPIMIDYVKNLSLWIINHERIKVETIPNNLKFAIYDGAVVSYVDILNRMYLGYYKYTCPENAVIKRYPRPEVFSYLKYLQDNKEFSICFHGNYFDKAVISENGEKTKITRDEAVINHNEIARWKFSDTNWKYNDFITEEEFYKEWDSIK